MAREVGDLQSEKTSRGSGRSRGTSAPPRQVKIRDSSETSPNITPVKKPERHSPSKIKKQEIVQKPFQSQNEDTLRKGERSIEERYARNKESVAIAESISADVARRRNSRSKTLHSRPPGLPDSGGKKCLITDPNTKSLLANRDLRGARKKSVGWADAPQITYFSSYSEIRKEDVQAPPPPSDPTPSSMPPEALSTPDVTDSKSKKTRARSWLPGTLRSRDSSLPANRTSRSTEAGDGSKRRMRSFREMFDLLQKRNNPPEKNQCF